MDETQQDMSMSIDDVNLSTMFGTSKPRPSNAPKAAIPAIVEEENEADDAGLFSKDRSEAFHFRELMHKFAPIYFAHSKHT